MGHPPSNLACHRTNLTRRKARRVEHAATLLGIAIDSTKKLPHVSQQRANVGHPAFHKLNTWILRSLCSLRMTLWRVPHSPRHPSKSGLPPQRCGRMWATCQIYGKSAQGVRSWRNKSAPWIPLLTKSSPPRTAATAAKSSLSASVFRTYPCAPVLKPACTTALLLF